MLGLLVDHPRIRERDDVLRFGAARSDQRGQHADLIEEVRRIGPYVLDEPATSKCHRGIALLKGSHHLSEAPGWCTAGREVVSEILLEPERLEVGRAVDCEIAFRVGDATAGLKGKSHIELVGVVGGL